jgi:prepilin-type N-terminal cleavage/methylation domain-containing protein
MKKGFTLVELLVTISIFAILTSVVLFSQAKFNSSILLTNLAYDTALTIRQAQTYGINIKNFVTLDEGTGKAINNFTPYGVHFETGENNNKSFVLFADLNDSGVFSGDVTTCEPADGCVNRYNITRGNYISDICRSPGSSGGEQCNDHIKSADIIFKRPNPDAIITVTKDNPQSTPATSIVFIKLTNIDGNSTSTVVVQENGLIYIRRD